MGSLHQQDLDAAAALLREQIEINAKAKWSTDFDKKLYGLLVPDEEGPPAEWALPPRVAEVQAAYDATGVWAAYYGSIHLRLAVLCAWAMMRRLTEPEAPDLGRFVRRVVDTEGPALWRKDHCLDVDVVDGLTQQLRGALTSLRHDLSMDDVPPGWRCNEDGDWYLDVEVRGQFDDEDDDPSGFEEGGDVDEHLHKAKDFMTWDVDERTRR